MECEYVCTTLTNTWIVYMFYLILEKSTQDFMTPNTETYSG